MGLSRQTGSGSRPPSPTAGQQQTTNLSASKKHRKKKTFCRQSRSKRLRQPTEVAQADCARSKHHVDVAKA